VSDSVATWVAQDVPIGLYLICNGLATKLLVHLAYLLIDLCPEVLVGLVGDSAIGGCSPDLYRHSASPVLLVTWSAKYSTELNLVKHKWVRQFEQFYYE
jgi:hypothetical protein